VDDGKCEAEEEGKPLPFFARNTKKAILSSVLSETASHTSGIVKQWLEVARPQVEKAKDAKKSSDKNAPAINKDFEVLISGGDGPTIFDLLQGKEIVKIGHDLPSGFKPSLQKNLVHIGIQRVLIEHQKNLEEEPQDEQLRFSVLGQRVIKSLRANKMIRGTVVSVDRSSEGVDFDKYVVMFDEPGQDDEECTVEEIYSEWNSTILSAP